MIEHIPMLIRFAGLLSLLVAVSLANIAIEKQILDLKRSLTLQVYRTELVLERHARLRIKIQELAGPTRTIDLLREGALHRPSTSAR